ncbi:kinetochore protein NDC80 homolog [Anabrus simplex]|uniref:kinetochore protein NDC80 homolog n=1 Tax=Anabrus simplex TaxID=316456 RepID=UPI0035A3B27E
MIRKLSSGFPKRHSLAAAQAQPQPQPQEIRDVHSSKKSEAQSSAKTGRVKKSLFPSGETAASSKLPVAATRLPRHRSVERDVGPTSGSVVRQKRRSRSYEGRTGNLFTTPSSSGMYRTPVGSAYRSSRRNKTSCILSAVKNVPKDTRPLTDKHFQSQALLQVQKYIERNHLSANYLPLTLTNPIKLKTFIEVMDFLLRKFYPTVKLNQSNYAEEIPVLMKKLMYPGTVNRSWLISANTPHAWPYVLGIMQYLVSLLDCDTGLRFVEMEGDPIMVHEVSIALHDDVKKAYTAYQRHGIEKFELSPLLMEEVLKKFNDLEGEMEGMKKEIEEMEAKLNDPALQARMEREKGLIKQLKDLTAEATSLKQQCHALQNERLSQDKRLAELGNKKAQIGIKVQEMKDQVTTVQRMLESQSLSVAERDELLAEISKIRDICKNHEKQKEDLQNSIYNETLEISRSRRNINKAIRQYNTNLLLHSDELPVKDLEINIDNVPEEEWAQYVVTISKRLEDYGNNIRAKLVKQEEKDSEAEAENQRLDEELALLSSQLETAEETYKLLRTAQKEKEEATRMREKRLEKRISELAEEQEQLALKEAKQAAEEKELTEKIKKLEQQLHFIRTKGKAFIEKKRQFYRNLLLRREQKENEMMSLIEKDLEEHREAKRRASIEAKRRARSPE